MYPTTHVLSHTYAFDFILPSHPQGILAPFTLPYLKVRKYLPKDINAKIREQLDDILGAEPKVAAAPPPPAKVSIRVPRTSLPQFPGCLQIPTP